MKATALLGLTCLLLIAADKPEEAVKKELEKLQGTWTVTNLRYNGKDFPTEGKNVIKFVFNGDQVTVEGDKSVQKEYAKLAWKLDPNAQPLAVDMTITSGIQRDAVIEGIYKVKDDELTVCAKVFGTKERPTQFDSPAGASVVLLVLKRDKP
jgi:uncharacterized protein (TIGR03067 family)